MATLLYAGKKKIDGKIVSEVGNLVYIDLDAGGSMLMSKSDVTVVPDKQAKKQAKKAYKKEHNTDVSEG